MDGHGPNPEDLGQLDHVDGRAVVTFRRWFPSPVAAVWRAVTEAEHLAAWFPTTIDGPRVAGGRLSFSFPHDEAPPFEGEMLVFEPPSVMALRWGDEVLRFEVAAQGDGALLVFTASFGDVGKVARDAAGWHACLDLLGYRVAGTVPPWSSADRWRQVHGGYVDRFGPAASTIGPPEGWERVRGDEDGSRDPT